MLIMGKNNDDAIMLKEVMDNKDYLFQFNDGSHKDLIAFVDD